MPLSERQINGKQLQDRHGGLGAVGGLIRALPFSEETWRMDGFREAFHETLPATWRLTPFTRLVSLVRVVTVEGSEGIQAGSAGFKRRRTNRLWIEMR